MRLSADPSTSPDDYEFAHRIRVRFVETDAMGIVHHSNYLAYFEETRVEYLRAIGHPFTEWRDAGLESPVLESFVQYRQPLAFDDEITVHLRLADVTRATFQMAYLITVDDDARGAPAGDRRDRARVCHHRRPADAAARLADRHGRRTLTRLVAGSGRWIRSRHG